MNRAAKQKRKLKTYLGWVVWDIERKAFDKDAALTDLLAMTNRSLTQKKSDKNKLYSIHEPSVRFITKGKA